MHDLTFLYPVRLSSAFLLGIGPCNLARASRCSRVPECRRALSYEHLSNLLLSLFPTHHETLPARLAVLRTSVSTNGPLYTFFPRIKYHTPLKIMTPPVTTTE